ncbi:TP901 family phage tail tape measure protein (plasmid) [Clostridioides difficile]|uniref:phage tail tape measure protein n=1 Tax=Clostridioides difficile TaxID=1496 RepID=UPI003B9F32FB
MSVDDASSAVNTIINGFRIEPLKEMQVQVGNTTKKTTELTAAMDMLNYAGNNYAIGTAGVAEAMKRGGSVLHEYGVSLGDTVGMITATNEAIQNPEKVGNGLKSVAINLAGMKINAKDGNLELNKTAMGLKEIAGITIYKNKDTGELKNMVEVLDEVKAKWGELREDEQKGLAEAIAGKQQAAIFQSLMGNYETFKEIRSEFSQGLQFGSAETENAQYLDSLAGRLNHLKETWVSIFSTLANSDMIYGMLDGLINLSEGIDKVIKSLDKMDMLLPATITSFAMLKKLREQSKEKKNQTTTINNNADKNTDESVKKVSKLATSYNKVKQEVNGATGAMNKLKVAGRTSITEISNLGKSMGSKFKNFATSIGSSLLSGFAIGAIISGITMLIQKYDEWNRRYEISAQKHRENIENTKSEISTLSQQQQSLKALSEEYNKLYNKTNKTSDELERFKQLQKQIADISPDLVAGYDEEGNPILAFSGSLDEAIGKLQLAIKEKNELLKTERYNTGLNAMNLAPKQKEDLKELNDKYVQKLSDNKKALDKAFGKGEGLKTKAIEKSLKEYKKAYEKRNSLIAEKNQEAKELMDEYNLAEAEIQQVSFDKIAEKSNYKNATNNVKSQINELMDVFNWHDISVTEQDVLVSGFDRLSSIISDNDPKLAQWNKRLQEANTNFQAGGNAVEYANAVDAVGREINKTLVAAGKEPIDTKLLEKGLQNLRGESTATAEALHAFLVSYDSSTAELKNGNGIAVKLKSQFDDLNNFISETLNNPDGKIDISSLIKINEGEAHTNLPKQVKEMIRGILGKDNNATEFEQQILMKVSTTIQNEGKLPEYVANQLNDIFNGKVKPEEINAPIKIGENQIISKEELKQLTEYYTKEENRPKIPIDFKTDRKELEKEAKEAKKALQDILDKNENKSDDDKKNITKDSLKKAIESKGISGSVESLNALNSALEKVPAEKKIDFINNSGDAFQGVKSLDEAIKKIPENKRLQYNVGVEGNEKLEKLKELYDKLPESIQGKINDGSININKIGNIKNLLDGLNKKDRKVAIDFIVKNPEQLDSFEKFYNGISDSKSKKLALEFATENPDKLQDGIKLYDSLKDGNQKKQILKFMVENPEKIQSATELYNNTPEGQKDLIYNFIVNNPGEINKVNQLIEKYPDKKTAILKMAIANPSVLEDIKNVNNLPDNIKKMLGIEVKGKEDVEETKKDLDEAKGNHNAELTVKTEGKEEAEETIDKVQNGDGTNAELLVSAKVQGLENGEVPGFDFENNEPCILKVKPEVTNKEELDNTKQKLDELNGKTATPTVDVKTEGKEEVEQTAEFIQGISPIKVVELSLNNQGKEELDNTKQKMDELNDEKVEPVVGAIGLEDTASKIASLGQQAEEFGQNNYNINLNAETSQGAKNISGLIARVKQYLALKVSTLVFRTETAQGAKNVSGLLAKVQSYVSKYGGKTIRTTFSALTATAAKNISGLIRKIESFKSNYAGKTFTTTFVTNKVTNSSGGGGGGNSSDKTNKTERTSVTNGTPIPANLSQPRTSEPAPISDETPVTKPSLFSRAVSRATSPIKALTEKFSRITKTPKIALDTKSIDAAVKYSIELLKELENAISKVTDRISLLDKKMKYASGKDKLKYLEEQNALYKEELTLLDQEDKALNTQKNRLKDRLKKDYKYTFSDDDNLTSYEEKLISLEKELEKLDKQSESDKGSKKSEERKKKIEEEKKVVEEYLKIAFTEIPKVADAQQEVTNSLIESTRAAEEFKKELKEIAREAALTSAQKHVTEIQNEIDLIDILMKNAEGDEKLDLIEKKKELLAKQAKEIKDVIKVYEDTAKELREGLSKEGFEFSADGKSITNYEQQLEFLKNNKDADKYKEIAENAKKYLDLLLKDLPDANKQIQQNKEEIEDLNEEIKDAYKEQLKEAQSLQEKIRDMYKKELEERLKEIDKETKAKIDSLKKQQDAYNDSRKEAKYQDDYEEQQDVISDLEKQIAIAERDSSLSGQKKLKDLQKQLKEEQKKLQDLVQDHVDDQVNDMYDKESDRLQEEADKLKEELEKKYSDENLVDLINEAISSGKFVGLDGEVKKLQDAIIEYINKYEDGMLAMGSVTKQEWLDRLKEGKETLEDINDILDELDLSKFAMPNYNPPSNSRSRSTSPISAVNYNSPFVVVQGNVTKDVMPEFEKKMRKMIEENNKKIISNTRS